MKNFKYIYKTITSGYREDFFLGLHLLLKLEPENVKQFFSKYGKVIDSAVIDLKCNIFYQTFLFHSKYIKVSEDYGIKLFDDGDLRFRKFDPDWISGVDCISKEEFYENY